jgi:hypothetical protein
MVDSRSPRTSAAEEHYWIAKVFYHIYSGRRNCTQLGHWSSHVNSTLRRVGRLLSPLFRHLFLSSLIFPPWAFSKTECFYHSALRLLAIVSTFFISCLCIAVACVGRLSIILDSTTFRGFVHVQKGNCWGRLEEGMCFCDCTKYEPEPSYGGCLEYLQAGSWGAQRRGISSFSSSPLFQSVPLPDCWKFASLYCQPKLPQEQERILDEFYHIIHTYFRALLAEVVGRKASFN